MILITTKISSVIDPIISRCQLFLIPRVKFENFENSIKKIADNESLEFYDDTIEILYKISEGRIFQAIDILQLSSITGNKIDKTVLYENAQRFQNDQIRSLLLMSLKGDFPKSREVARKILSNYKFTTHELFKLLLNEINKLPLSRYVRSEMINLIADADFRALDGRDSDIQISALLSKICLFSQYL
jgi:DNA polymerase III delta prime subunit